MRPLVTVLLAALLTSCAGAAVPREPRTTDPVIGVAPRENLGNVLTADGMTVYIYSKDSPHQTVCYDICAMDWPPLLITRPTTPSRGLPPNAFGTVTRRDGSTQLTYRGRPLYLYIEDPPGTDQANGQNVDGEWFVVYP